MPNQGRWSGRERSAMLFQLRPPVLLKSPFQLRLRWGGDRVVRRLGIAGIVKEARQRTARLAENGVQVSGGAERCDVLGFPAEELGMTLARLVPPPCETGIHVTPLPARKRVHPVAAAPPCPE